MAGGAHIETPMRTRRRDRGRPQRLSLGERKKRKARQERLSGAAWVYLRRRLAPYAETDPIGPEPP